jgi:U4/U6 small nuclear ribonucleoprotein PRP3
MHAMVPINTLKVHEPPCSVLVYAFVGNAGIMVLCPGTFNLVVVEGCPKSLKRYHKLMLRRIDWNATPLPQPGKDDEDADDGDVVGAGAEDKAPNNCHLVWEVSLV